jgi:hypothetical protein
MPQLLCTTPSYTIDFTWMAVKVVLIAVDRAEYAKCPSNQCTFQYRSDHTPLITHLQRAAGSLENLDYEGYLRAANGVHTS